MRWIPILPARTTTWIVLLSVSLLGLTPSVTSAQDRATSFAGNWVLDMKRTKDLPATLQGYRLQVAQNEQELRVETEVLGEVRGARGAMRGGGMDGGIPGGGRAGGRGGGGMGGGGRAIAL